MLCLMALAVPAAAVLTGQPADRPGHAVPLGRLARLSKGANICRWFRYPANDSDAHFGDYIWDSEAQAIRRIGLRHVRLCISPQVIYDPANPSVPILRAQAFIDRAIERFHRADLAVMVDIHNEDQKRIMDNAEWREGFVAFWGAYAKHLSKFDPEKTFLEIVNEPVFDGREGEWYALQKRLASTIRASAPKHTIVATGANWGGVAGLQKLEPLDDRNVVYSFHFYDPFPFTHQGATWTSEEMKVIRDVPYPSSPELVAPLLSSLTDAKARGTVEWYGNERWGRTKMAESLGRALNWGKLHKVPLYCGEFGVYPVVAPAESRARWFKDMGEILAESGAGWAVWGWDEGFGLSRSMRDGKLVVDPVVAKSLGLSLP